MIKILDILEYFHLIVHGFIGHLMGFICDSFEAQLIHFHFYDMWKNVPLLATNITKYSDVANQNYCICIYSTKKEKTIFTAKKNQNLSDASTQKTLPQM